MGVLFGPRSETRGIDGPVKIETIVEALRDARASVSTAGGVSDPESAMRHDAVWSCVTAKAEDVSMFPVDVVRYDGSRRVVVEAPQIITAPSVKVADPMDWRYQVLVSWLTDGNAWGMVTSLSPQGLPTRIELLSPKQVTWTLEGKNRDQLRFAVDGERQHLWPAGQLWHAPAYTWPGAVVGLSPIQHHALSIGAGIAANRFSGEFFDAGGHPTSILSPLKDPGPENASKLKQAFLTATKRRQPAVLPQDIKYQQVQINPEDSQFIDAMRYSVEQICRIYREDPADHGSSASGSTLTYANRSDADLARLKRRQFWVVKLQNTLSALLPPGQQCRLNTSAALMMTTKERHEVHNMRLAAKTKTVNEVRTDEDEEPFGPEFDAPGIPTAPAIPSSGGDT